HDAVNEARIPPPELLPADGAHRRRVEHHIRALGEREEELPSARPRHVERDPALRRVEREPKEGAVRVRDPAAKGRAPPRGVAARRLHLDHVRADVAEELPGEEARLAGEVEDPGPVEVAARRPRGRHWRGQCRSTIARSSSMSTGLRMYAITPAPPSACSC